MTQSSTSNPENSNSWFMPEKCFFCGGERLEPWLDGIRDRLGHVPGSWSFLRCGDCGSAHLAPMPRPEIIPGLYPDIYSFREDFETDGRAKGVLASIEKKVFYRLTHKNEVETVKRFTGLVSGSLLDVGCGTGDRLSRFAEAGFSVRGMEIQPELVDYVRDQLGFEADAGTLDSVAYPPESFDIVISHWVLEHLLDVHAALEKVRDMLKPGGWFVAEVPLADSLQATLLGGRWTQFGEAPRHLAVPSQEGVRRAFTACGFSDIGIAPSSIMDCSSSFALSVIPGATAKHAYGSSSLLAHAPRVAAGFLTVLHTPAAAVENHLLHRPAGSLVFARKNPASR